MEYLEWTREAQSFNLIGDTLSITTAPHSLHGHEDYPMHVEGTRRPATWWRTAMNLKAMYKNIGYGDTEIEEIESTRKNYQTSVYYMDIVSELEKMGDL